MAEQPPALRVRNLDVVYGSSHRRRSAAVARAVRDVSFDLQVGDVFGLVGESGSGKSSVARAVACLVPAAGGEVAIDGHDVLRMTRRELQRFRRHVQIVFQNPLSSFNPWVPVGLSVAEPLQVHRGDLSRQARRDQVAELLASVGLSPVLADRLPRQLSGGQLQRASIARALALDPRLLILDEPLSALDVSSQSQILELLNELRRTRTLTVLMISHDLTVMRGMSTKIGVMHAGELVEVGPAIEVFERPQHPYTAALLSAVPLPNPDLRGRRRRIHLQGEVIDPSVDTPGCRFASRCPARIDDCLTSAPPMREVGDGHTKACIREISEQILLTSSR